jgi:hypothetical protein
MNPIFICCHCLLIVVGVESSSCEACSEPGDIRGQLFCTNCDKHYHGECLMLESNRVVRTGWRCPDCKICQTCRQAGDDAEMIMCNVCDKGYHTFCLRNQSIPKDGWSCSSCLSLTHKNAPIQSICSLCQNEISSKQIIRQCHLCQSRIHSSCHSSSQSMTDDYYDDDSAYICRSCSISSSSSSTIATTITSLPIDEGDDDDEQNQKEIYRSSSISKMNRLVNRSQKSSVSSQLFHCVINDIRRIVRISFPYFYCTITSSSLQEYRIDNYIHCSHVEHVLMKIKQVYLVYVCFVFSRKEFTCCFAKQWHINS